MTQTSRSAESACGLTDVRRDTTGWHPSSRHWGRRPSRGLRIGIGRPPREKGGLAGHVLEGFSAGEVEAVGTMIAEAAEAIEVLLRDGVKEAMNRFNRRRDEGGTEA